MMKRKDKKDYDYKQLMVGISIVIVVLGVYLMIDAYRNSPAPEKSPYYPCASKICLSKGYDSVYDIRLIQGKYYIIICEGIVSENFTRVDFDYYPQDIKEACDDGAEKI